MLQLLVPVHPLLLLVVVVLLLMLVHRLLWLWLLPSS
jgi:hypothetical protein